MCRLCSNIERNVIHLYTDEGIQKKLEQKINVYLKINLSRYDPLPKVICIPCELKLEQHHRFIQRVIQNQKKIQGNRPIIPLLEQHLRVRVTPADSDSNTYNIEPISSSDSSDSDEEEAQLPTAAENEQAEEMLEEIQEQNQAHFMDTSSSSSSSSSTTDSSSSEQSMEEEHLDDENSNEDSVNRDTASEGGGAQINNSDEMN